MRAPLRERRRPNLATIVGSGLAVAAAGSLLAFSSLAEQAGLQGLATGGIQPAVPGRGDATKAITIPAPATGPREPGDLRELVRGLPESIAAAPPEPAPETPRAPAAPRRPARPERQTGPSRPERLEEPALAAREVAPAAPDPWSDGDAYGPPYGRAKGHDKHDKKPKSQKPRHTEETAGGPVYARSTAGNEKPKPPKMKKVKKVGKVQKSPARGKAKGHGKHDHSQGKGKGHSKHGH